MSTRNHPNGPAVTEVGQAEPNRNKAVTLSDVALAAGVSAITASRALRTPGVVSAKVRARVDAAVQSLGYVPNPAAQALASARSSTVGVIIPSVTNSVFSALLAGVLDGLEGTGFQAQFGNTRYLHDREDALVRLFAAQRPVGMIIAGVDQTPQARAVLSRLDCPVVQVMEIGPDPIDMMIGCDHAVGGRAVARHLIDQGYSRPAFLGARMDPRAKRRLAGFRDVTEAAGLYDPARVVTVPQPSSVALGGRLLSDLLELAPDTDAVFCLNDDLALGVLFECQRRGLRVPAQIGIAGFNDLDYAGVCLPGLTTIRTHRYDMGHRAVQMLLAAAADGTRPAERVIDLGCPLVARGSTARRTLMEGTE
jgi:LacI family transcriptional regulator, gluconate utilization system Gnt-I transcriptional repressor